MKPGDERWREGKGGKGRGEKGGGGSGERFNPNEVDRGQSPSPPPPHPLLTFSRSLCNAPFKLSLADRCVCTLYRVWPMMVRRGAQATGRPARRAKIPRRFPVGRRARSGPRLLRFSWAAPFSVGLWALAAHNGGADDGCLASFLPSSLLPPDGALSGMPLLYSVFCLILHHHHHHPLRPAVPHTLFPWLQPKLKKLQGSSLQLLLSILRTRAGRAFPRGASVDGRLQGPLMSLLSLV